MPFKGITINTRPEVPAHIEAEDDAAIYQSFLGMDGVFEIGQKFMYRILSNNKIRIEDGVLCLKGRIGRIAYGDTEDLTIENGASGQNRHDLIIAKFVSTSTEDVFTIEVKKGLPSQIAVDPALVQENLYEYGKTFEMPLYRVVINGLNISRVVQLYDTIPTIEKISRLNKYNTNEVIVGTWFDGKPIYKKTALVHIEEKDLPTIQGDTKSGAFDIGFGVGDISKVIRMDITANCSAGAVNQYYDGSGVDHVGGDSFRAFYLFEDAKLHVKVGKDDPRRPLDIIVTLEYVKMK